MRVAKIEGDRKNISLKRDSYYTLVELKGRLKAATWGDLIEKVKNKLDECEKRRYKPLY